MVASVWKFADLVNFPPNLSIDMRFMLLSWFASCMTETPHFRLSGVFPNTIVHVTDLVSRLLDWMFDLTVSSIIFHNKFCEWVCNVACDVRFLYFAYFPNPLRILRTSRKCSKNIFYVLKRSRMRKKYEIRNELVQNDFTDRLSRLRPLRSTEYLSITAY